MFGTTESRRVALGVEYHGGAYAGWQAQRSPGVPTVQETLEAALSRVANHPVSVVCAGRTDAGVHASAQVAPPDEVLPSDVLPADVAVQWAREVGPDFHARFSARYRRYRYLVLTRAQRSALAAGSACLERRPLDAPRMHEAAQCLLGERDFSAFRGAGCQSRTPMRRLDHIAVSPKRRAVETATARWPARPRRRRASTWSMSATTRATGCRVRRPVLGSRAESRAATAVKAALIW